MAIKVETIYMPHDGGTKFYELVLLTSNVTDRAALIKRWAVNEHTETKGGETLLKRGTAAECRRERDSTFKAKSRRGYQAGIAGFGLHKISKVGAHDMPQLLGVAGKHYKADTVKWIGEVFDNEDANTTAAMGKHFPDLPAAPTNKSKTESYSDWGLF